jgi:putative ABC transport system permease protein
MNSISQDVIHAIRILRKQGGFTATVVLTLALGIGANTAIFSVVHAVILKPLPFHDPDRLVHIWESHPKGERYQWGSKTNYITVRPGTYQDWRAQSRSFASITGYFYRGVLLTDGAQAEELGAHEVDDGFFEALGVSPLLGRTFSSDDFAAADGRAVLLSYELWQKRFAGDRGIIGRTISLDGVVHSVIGVMPDGFYATRWDKPKLWLPLHWDPQLRQSRVKWGMTTFARLKPGVSLQQAQTEMDVISDRMAHEYPNDYDDMSAVVTPVSGYTYSQYEKLLFFLEGAVTLVLLIACMNVANLMLAHATERGKEFSVRAALGAPRSRLVRQLLTESLMLAVAGGSVGLIFALIGIPSLLSLLPQASGIPRIESVGLDWPVLAFTAAASLCTGVLFGLVPAVRASRINLNDALKESGRNNSSSYSARHLSNLLIVGEVAMSLILLVAASLLVRSFLLFMRTDPGFNPDKVLAISIAVPTQDYGIYKIGGANPLRARLYQDLRQRVAVLPGVKSATVTAYLPFRHGADPWGMHIDGLPAAPGAGPKDATHSNGNGLYYQGDVSIERVDSSYFETFQMPLLRGRSFEARDSAGNPNVALVSESTARRYFQNHDPIGRHIVLDMTSYLPGLTVVGIVADSYMHGLNAEVYPLVFWPLAQFPSRNCWLAVRTNANPVQISTAVQREIRRLNPDLAITEVKTMDTVIGESLWQQRLSAVLLGLFGILATMLAVAGIYAVFSYAVSRRAKEIGLRIALGAGMRGILVLVLGSALRLALAGIVTGTLATLALGRLIASQLHGVASNDPVTTCAVALSLLIAAVIACWVPARRAARVDPLTALRED